MADRRAVAVTHLHTDLKTWKSRGGDIFARVRSLLKELSGSEQSPETRIGDLPQRLELRRIEDAVGQICDQVKAPIIFLIDKLDEGYEPDTIGIGLVDGLVQAGSDLKTRVPNVRPALFLRDNMFRAVQNMDPDYSRNVEGQVLRLHWDEASLLDFAAARLRIALDIDEDSSQRVWNGCTSEELRGREGFLEVPSSNSVSTERRPGAIESSATCCTSRRPNPTELGSCGSDCAANFPEQTR